MNYQQFLFTIVNGIQAELEAGCVATLQTVMNKQTEKIKAVSIYRGNQRKTPLIYMAPFYCMHQNGYSVAAILKEIQNVLCMTENRAIKEDIFLDFASAAPNLSLRLISAKRNETLLKMVPCRRFLDLALIYQMNFSQEESTVGSAVIFEEHRKLWNVTEDILFQTAAAATLERESMVLKPLSAFFTNPELDLDQKMYVLTNNSSLFGAALMLYPTILRQCCSELGERYFILPSSVHELILLPYEEQYNPQTLKEMVCEINEIELLPHEILSDHVYQYDSNSEKVVILA